MRIDRFNHAARIAVIYGLLATVWILSSDWIAESVIGGEALSSRVQTAKGLFFVIATAVLLYFFFRRRERLLLERESYRRKLLESLGEPVFLHDGATGTLLETNGVGLELRQRTAAFFDAIPKAAPIAGGPPPFTPGTAKALILAAAAGEPQSFEWEVEIEEGVPGHFEMLLHPVPLGGEVHVLAVAHDISARKAAEKERRQLELQLRQAQKLEAIGRLAGGVAHDFNNLLTPILGYVDMGLDDVRDPQLHEYFEQIQRAGLRGRDLSRQLLAMGRKQHLDVRLVGIDDVVDGSRRMLRRLIAEDIVFHVELGASTARINADAGQLEQVLVNLVVNASDAMPEGGSLTIATEVTTLDAHDVATHPPLRPGAHAVLTVADTGCGMDAPTLDRAFEPFFTTKSPEIGTGLGLS